jgi:hypothetical protein
VKTPDKKADPKKQKKQLIALGVLAAAFVAVMLVQFGGSEPKPEAAALAVAPDSAQTVVSAAMAAAAATAATPAAPATAAVASTEPAKDNAVLSEPAAGGMTRSPFSNFWSAPSPRSTAAVPDVAAPTVTLNATMPSAKGGMAVIDGQLHFVGDMISSWQLVEVRERAIVLRGPSANSQIVVDMPVLSGKLALPVSAR